MKDNISVKTFFVKREKHDKDKNETNQMLFKLKMKKKCFYTILFCLQWCIIMC